MKKENKTMTSNIQEQETRRLNIIDGVNEGFGNTKIAAKLGVPLWTVIGDLKKMRHNRDTELQQAYSNAAEQVQVNKRLTANIPEERFHHMTGMSLMEKTFNNMMSFYEPELRKILKSENESDAIRELPDSVRKTLKHNGIIAQGWKTPEITKHARLHLTSKPSNS